MPAMQRAAIFASGRPVAFDTNGTVREARGFTSSRKIRSSPSLFACTANWVFIRPITLSALRQRDHLFAQRSLRRRRQRIRRQRAGRIA